MTEQTEEGRVESLDERFNRLEQMIQRALGGQAGAEEEAAPADPKAEMRAELAKLQAAEKRKQAREADKAATESRFRAIEDKISEKPPEEHRKGVAGWWQRSNQWTREQQK